MRSRLTEHDTPLPVTVESLTGAALPEAIPVLAALRMDVFRAWPYLYDGRAEYEEAYLGTYARSPRSAFIVARQGGQVVGAATCIPLSDETAKVQAPFLERGLDPEDFFYLGESVLLPALRGQGIGVAFFAAREAHARAVSACRFACFCGVVRPDGHPAHPAGYTRLDAFWTRRGYTRRPDLACEMAWTDLGETVETDKTLVFWLKSLTGAPLP